MISRSWKDCKLIVDGETVVLQNAAICSRWRLNSEGLALVSLENRATGYCWEGMGTAPVCMTPPQVQPEWDTQILETDLRSRRWRVQCTWRDGCRSVCRWFVLYPESPFLTTGTRWENPPEDAFRRLEQRGAVPTGAEEPPVPGATSFVFGDVMMVVPLPRAHLRWSCIRLVDQTDVHDTLVWEQSALVYPAECVECSGSFLAIEDVVTGESLLVGRHAPITPAPGPQFRLERGSLYVLQNGCAGPIPEGAVGCDCVLGVGAGERLWEAYRRFYRLGWQAPWQSRAMLTSNTWGDRNRDSRVCEAFLVEEIRRAAIIGLDAVQIDDGWQKGTTQNSASPHGGVWEGYYGVDPDFWTPHPVRFPNGLEPVASYAASQGVALGLWFSPDSSKEFANWRRDADTLLNLWCRYKVAIFKLDGVKLSTPLARKRYLSLLERVSALSQRQILLQQDITAQERMGYLAERQYGTLFVENRYTDFANYYPHRTLRNLWMLCRYIPAQRMQFEVPNPRRNTERYQDDPFAPERYSMDYLFASVMPAQPLLWMELSGLGEGDWSCLERIIAIFRQHRDAMWRCDVRPIGQEPSGQAFTGFVWQEPQQRREGYLLLLREYTRAESFAFFEAPRQADLRLLCANHPVSSEYRHDGTLHAHFVQPRTYAFYRWTTTATQANSDIAAQRPPV